MIPHESLLLRIFIANIGFIWGFYLACRIEFHSDERPDLGYDKHSKNIFWKVKYFSLKYLGEFLAKPICTCPICMSSIHSIIIYTLFVWYTGWDWRFIVGWLLYVPCLGFANYILSLIFNKMED